MRVLEESKATNLNLRLVDQKHLDFLQEYYIPELVNTAIENDLKVQTYMSFDESKYLRMNTKEDPKCAQNILLLKGRYRIASEDHTLGNAKKIANWIKRKIASVKMR